MCLFNKVGIFFSGGEGWKSISYLWCHFKLQLQRLRFKREASNAGKGVSCKETEINAMCTDDSPPQFRILVAP